MNALVSLLSSPPLLHSRLKTPPKSLPLPNNPKPTNPKPTNPKPLFPLRHLRRDFSVAFGEDDADFPGADYFDDEGEEADNEIDYEIEYDKVLYDDQGRELTGGSGGDAELAPLSTGGFVSTVGWEADTLVDYRINEDKFHKISLWDCDFFIRKEPDPDDDVYDFREMYVSPPDTDVYSIPKVLAPMPKKLIRCSQKEYVLFKTYEPPVDGLRSPLNKTEKQVLKVFLTKHYKNRRKGDEDFVLDFEEIYVIDSKARSITRAKVIVTIPGGKDRDRRKDLLTIRDNGTSFKIISESERDHPQTVIHKREWAKSRDAMEKYLRKFRDFDQSNWF